MRYTARGVSRELELELGLGVWDWDWGSADDSGKQVGMGSCAAQRHGRNIM